MTQQTVMFEEGSLSRTAKQVGYGFAVAINLLLAWVVTGILEWDVLPFLTEDFSRVQPIMIASFLVGAFVNLIYLIYDSKLAHSLGEIVTSVISFVVTAQLLIVFPFEFTDGPWEWMTRAMLVFVAIAVVIATVVNLVELIVSVTKGEFETDSVS
jgi:predicted neutral ceramidase superfamily lipid hydrolase